MKQNTVDATEVVATEWHRVRACWSEMDPPLMSNGAALVSIDNGTRLSLAPGDPSPESAPDQHDACVLFALRNAHPRSTMISPVAAPYLLVVRVFASDGDRDEFRRWLDEEHARRQVSLPGVNWYLGYEEQGAAHSFLNLWSIDEPEIVDGTAWERIRDTPWWSRVKHIPANADRGVYRQVGSGSG